jgi:hypothetical protein
VALQRGPIVYCLEQCDNKAPVRAVLLPDRARLRARFDRRLLGGCVVVEGGALAVSPAGCGGELYCDAGCLTTRRVRIKAIPYFLWDNRKPGAMTVWIPRA